uniref:Uncharacterized protein n=1 Tax=Meloidogyne enterolobii TaxID=390850 RepID=A0A6V7UMV7_MELEN|nr:unnamed protein product [Meloidogyne enterolobii]
MFIRYIGSISQSFFFPRKLFFYKISYFSFHLFKDLFSILYIFSSYIISFPYFCASSWPLFFPFLLTFFSVFSFPHHSFLFTAHSPAIH